MLSIRRSMHLWPAAALALLLSTGSLAADPHPAGAAQPKAGAEKAGKELKLEDPPGVKGLKYRLLGPAWGGRTTRAAGVPGAANLFYFTAASGGVWKSTDGGKSFSPVFDDQPISSIGSLAIAPSDPNVIYVGSGEANIRGNVAAGNGIYKSTDAGKSWSHVWVQEGQIGEMAVDPRSSDVAFAAVLGHAFGPNPERGVYRTKDGGKSWVQVLKKDEWTGASSVTLDPNNPNVVFAGLWQARRRPWEMTSGGPGGGLWLSRDGGDSWKQLTGGGLPDGLWGKVGVAIAPSDGRRVYALIENEKGGLFRSDDGGESWTLTSSDRRIRQRAWYYTTLTVHPTQPNEVWVPNVPLLRSLDGGKTFDFVEGGLHHGDYHDVWFDPKNPKRMIVSNDGGVDVSFDGGESWSFPPLPIGQFYHASVDSRKPFYVAGALQDIGTAQGPSDTLAYTGIRNLDWRGVGGGEAGFVASDTADPDIIYAGEYGGTITRYDHETGQARNVSIYTDNPSGHGGEDLLYRFQWTAPIAVSPHDPKTIYHGGNVLFRTRDAGQTWEPISPDLTRNDKSKQKWSGGPITGDNTGVETYATIFAIAESTVSAGTLWAGSDDGLVHVTRDGGEHWDNVTPAVPGLPEWGTVSMIEPSAKDAGTAYLVVDAHRLDDMTPYLWKTSDFGKSWRRLGMSGNPGSRLRRDVYLHAVRTDPARPGVLYLATERGVLLSTDDGTTWRSLKLNLPTVAVHDLAVSGDSLVVGTHGRSMWILDDTSLLFQLSDEVRKSDLHLFPAPDAVRWTLREGVARQGVWTASNPERGVRVAYWLGKALKGEVTLEVYTDSGRLVARRSSKAAEASGSSEYGKFELEELKTQVLGKEQGLNFHSWDLLWDGAEMIPGSILDAGYPAYGPTALPGTYTFKLSVDGQSQSMTAKVVADPRFPVVTADLAAQLDLALAVREDLTRLTRTVERLRSIKKQVTARTDLVRKDETNAELVQASDAAVAKLDALEGKLHNPKATIVYDVLALQGGAQLYSRMAPLFDTIKGGDGAPTQGMREEYAREKADLDRYAAELEALIAGDLAALDRQAQAAGLPGVWAGK